MELSQHRARERLEKHDRDTATMERLRWILLAGYVAVAGALLFAGAAPILIAPLAVGALFPVLWGTPPMRRRRAAQRERLVQEIGATGPI